MKKHMLALVLCAALSLCAAGGTAKATGDGLRDLQWAQDYLNRAIEQKDSIDGLDDLDRMSDGTDLPDEITGPADAVKPADKAAPTATPKPTPTPKPTATPTPAPTATPKPTPTPKPTATPIPTATPEPVPVTAISFASASGLKVSVYEKADLSRQLVLKPSNATTTQLVWTVSDQSVASISDQGALSPRRAGSVTVTVSDPASRKSAKMRVTVTQPVDDIQLSESSVTVFKGKTVKVNAAVVPADASNKKVQWESEDTNIAKVSANGTITGVGAGSTWIHCRATDGTGKDRYLRVTVNVAVKKITLASREMTLVIGKSGGSSWNVEPSDATNKNVKWTSSNSSIASVDSYGNVTAKSVGSCVITATARDGSDVKAQFTAYVEPKVPVYIDYLWWETKNYAKTGRYALDVISNCVNRKIRGFSVDMNTYVSKYSTPQFSSNFFSARTVNPGKRVKTEWSYLAAPGLANAGYVEVTVTDVYFSDGTFYVIPMDLRETIRFNMNTYSY